MAHDTLWGLAHLSDPQLLESLNSVLLAQRRTLASLVAHLGEVEDRRLHLQAAYPSMFAYCVERLGMSEDEACRRIDLARLARRFPALLAELQNGQITLSVALMLKPVLSEANHLELLAAARGKSMREARELVASRFPSPDAPSNIRKLPERRTLVATTAEVHSAAAPEPALTAPTSALLPAERAEKPFTAPAAAAVPPHSAVPAVHSRNRIEPVSDQRYRIQFTADAALKGKLEQARDLLRHTHPNGDFAPIVARALDLLIEDLLRRRFGAGARARHAGATPKSDPTPPAAAPMAPPPSQSTNPPSQIGRCTRRQVLERDGLGCSWVSPEGERCGSQAWLELDHRHPAGKGGSAEVENLRWLCRAHNQLAAEQAYGRRHIERARARRRAAAEAPPVNAGI